MGTEKISKRPRASVTASETEGKFINAVALMARLAGA